MKHYENEIREDRVGFLRRLAGRIYDGYPSEAFRQVWVALNDGTLPFLFPPLHEVDDGRLIKVMLSYDATDLTKLAVNLKVEPEHLDIAVYDCGGNEDINNDGLEAQITFLLAHNSYEDVKRIIQTVDEAGNYER